MSEDTISVRIASDKKAALDAIAARTHRNLSLVIHEALNAISSCRPGKSSTSRKACGRPMPASSHQAPTSAPRSPDGGADDQVDPAGGRESVT
jgi:hypothetical protein